MELHIKHQFLFNFVRTQLKSKFEKEQSGWKRAIKATSKFEKDHSGVSTVPARSPPFKQGSCRYRCGDQLFGGGSSTAAAGEGGCWRSCHVDPLRDQLPQLWPPAQHRSWPLHASPLAMTHTRFTGRANYVPRKKITVQGSQSR